MKNSIFIVFILFQIIACEQKEEINLLNKNELILRWHSGRTDVTQRVFIFESEHDYLRNITNLNNETHSYGVNNSNLNLDYNREARFTDIKALNYYVVIINDPIDSDFIEHNLNFPNQLKDPLVDFAKTTLKMYVANQRINAAKITKLEYKTFPAGLDLEVGDPYKYTLYSIHKTNGEVTVLDTLSLTVDDSNSLLIQPQIATPLNFNSNHHLKYTIGITDRNGNEHQTPIQLINLLNKKMYFDTKFSQYDSVDQPILTFDVNWK